MMTIIRSIINAINDERYTDEELERAIWVGIAAICVLLVDFGIFIGQAVMH
jgi:hypothetical protein